MLRAATMAVLPANARSEGKSMWSMCACDSQHQINGRKFLQAERRGDVAFRSRRAESQVNATPIAERGIGEDADAVEVDQHRRVAQPANRDGVVRPLASSGLTGAGRTRRPLSATHARNHGRCGVRTGQPHAAHAGGHPNMPEIFAG